MNYTKFESRHKLALKNILQDEELFNWTTDRQEKNGTIAIHDAATGVTYTLHTSGYIRHNDENGFGSSFWLGGGTNRSWQLNRVVKGRYGRTERLLADADEQIVILLNSIPRDRKLQKVKDLRFELDRAIISSRKK